MAKTRQEIENRILTPVITFMPKTPKKQVPIKRCGCGRQASYEVYEHQEPHCHSCMLEATDCSQPVLVRRLDGGYDDAS